MPFLRISNARVQNTAFIDATVMMTAWFLATIIYTPILVVGFSAVPSNNYIKSKVPEDVVQYQLDAFQQGNIEKAFKYNSIDNQRVTGPWQSFAASLSDQPFRPILCHTKATVLMTVSHNQNTDDEYVCCLVKVVPQNNQPLPKSLLNVIENAELVVCPDCTMISPVDQTATICSSSAEEQYSRYGVGVGIKPEAVRDWIRSNMDMDC